MLTIGITGGTGSGKTTILNKIKEKFNEKDIGFISQDSYYNVNGDLSFEEKNKINFDHPDAVDFELMINHLIDLKNGVNINQPIYSFFDHNRTEETKTIETYLNGILTHIDSNLIESKPFKVVLSLETLKIYIIIYKNV